MESEYSNPATSSYYAVLCIGEVYLLLPQNQVRTLEPAFDIQYAQEESIGWITVEGTSSPVYCLSKNIEPIREVPDDLHICALLNVEEGFYGILCNQVGMLKQSEIQVMSLPECMCTPTIPFNGLVLHDNKVLCVTSADELLDCIDKQIKPAVKFVSAKPITGEAV